MATVKGLCGTIGNPIPGINVVIVWRSLADPRLHLSWLLGGGGLRRPNFMFFHQSPAACRDRSKPTASWESRFCGRGNIATLCDDLRGVFSMRLRHAAQNCKDKPLQAMPCESAQMLGAALWLLAPSLVLHSEWWLF